MGLLESISQSSLIRWVAESDWGYPIVLTSHAIGMAMVVGIMLMYDLRVLGFAAQLPIATIRQYFSVAWAGFAINLISGTLLFLANYTAFLHNAAFITKISLLCLAALATYFLSRMLFDSTGESETKRAKVLAVVCVLFWLGAITAGRIVGYTSVPE